MVIIILPLFLKFCARNLTLVEFTNTQPEMSTLHILFQQRPKSIMQLVNNWYASERDSTCYP